MVYFEDRADTVSFVQQKSVLAKFGFRLRPTDLAFLFVSAFLPSLRHQKPSTTSVAH